MQACCDGYTVTESDALSFVSASEKDGGDGRDKAIDVIRFRLGALIHRAFPAMTLLSNGQSNAVPSVGVS